MFKSWSNSKQQVLNCEKEEQKAPYFAVFTTKYGVFLTIYRTTQPHGVIPTRCRDLRLKQFCLEGIAPAILIVLITHIIIAVRWMLIKILSAVINHQVEYTVIVVVGLYVL